MIKRGTRSGKSALLLLCALVFIFSMVPVTGRAQDAEKELNLEKIADDWKFRNGIQFIQLKKYDLAMQELQEYLEIYTDGIHRNEAYTHMAGIYFQGYNYQKAIEVYKSLYEEFGNTEEGIGAYYKTGICYQKMGYDSMAVMVFREIINEHPDSRYAYKSQIQMDLLSILKDGQG